MRNAERTVLLALLSCLVCGSSFAQRVAAPSEDQAVSTPKKKPKAKHHTKAQPKATPQVQEELAAQAEAQPRAGDKAPPKLHPRRHSTQTVQGVTPIPQAGGLSYGPSMAPSPPTPATSPGMPPPAQINNCIGGRCTDASGATYNTGVGNAAIDSQGRLCNRSGTTMQCF